MSLVSNVTAGAASLKSSALLFFSRPKKRAPDIVKKDVIKEGWLEKQSLHWKEWKVRWCVLTAHFLLSYESEKSENGEYRNPTEYLRISKCSPPVPADDETSKSFSFKVSTLNRVFFLVACSEEDRDSWIEEISLQSTYTWEPISKGDLFPERAVHNVSDPSQECVYVARNLKGECGKMTSSDGKADEIFCHHGGRNDHGEVLLTNAGKTAHWVSIKRGDLLPAGAVYSGHTVLDGDLYVARSACGQLGKLNLIEGSACSIWSYDGGQTEEGEVLCVSSVTASADMSLRCASPRNHITRSNNSAADQASPVLRPQDVLPDVPSMSSSTRADSGLEDSQAFLAALEPKSAALKWWRSQLDDLMAQGQQAYAYSQPPIDSILGEGTYGCVWKAQHRYTSELFAVKNMKTKNAGVREAIAMNELRVAERIREQPHACIVSLYMVEHFTFSTGGLYMLVMEYCPGGDLLKKIFGRIVGDTYSPPEQVLMWMGHIFLALEHLHLTVESLVRDLKPANVVLSRSGCAKLTDFGYGKLFTESDGTWSYACPPGSPGYIAPEVLSQEPYNTCADFYSFGVVLWVALSGGWHGLANEPGPPVSSGKDFNSFKEDWRVLARALENPRMGRRAISEEAKELISRLTQRNPSDRPDHAGIRQSRLFTHLQLPEQRTATSAPGAVWRDIENWRPPSGIRV